jgi:hypothetical protein
MLPSVMDEASSFRIERRSALRLLMLVAGTLFALHFVVMYAWFVADEPRLLGVTPVFNVDEEVSLATFQQILHLLGIAIVLYAIGRTTQRHDGDHAAGWLSLSALAFYLAADESATLHETLTPLLRRTVEVGGLLYLPWLVVALAILVAFVGWHLPLLRHLDHRTRNGLIAGAVLFAIGAVGLDTISGEFVESRTALDLVVLAPIEEAMEVVAQLIVLSVLLTYVAKNQPFASIRVVDRRQPPA